MFQCLHVLFTFETGDAAGQNASTVCTWAAVKWINERYKEELPGVHVEHSWIDAQLSGDKKPCQFNAVMGMNMELSELFLCDIIECET